MPIASHARPQLQLDTAAPSHYEAPLLKFQGQYCVMRVRNSLRSAKVRDKNCRVVRRRGRVYVINKKNPRMKCRQG
jgi:large subunit ribosomal protein L36